MNKSGYVDSETIVAVFGIGVVVLILVWVFLHPILGTFPFGPQREVTATVTRLYVDARGENGSSYMVGTDKGVFEVDNSLWLWKWNADHRYSQLKEGKSYRLTVKGNEVVGFLFQSYGGIIGVEAVE